MKIRRLDATPSQRGSVLPNGFSGRSGAYGGGGGAKSVFMHGMTRRRWVTCGDGR